MVLFLSLLPSMALLAHWPQSDPVSGSWVEAGVHVRASHDHGDPGDGQGATCDAQRPCADAAAHGISGGSWIGESDGPWHLSGTTVQAIRAPGSLYTQTAVSPDPFPPRFTVS